MQTVQQIYAMYEKRGNVDKGHRAHLGASILGHKCERYLWYSFRWAVDVEHNGQLLRLFDTGNHAEPRFVDDLRRIGVTVEDVCPGTGEQWRFMDCDGHVGGSMDAHAIGFSECPTTHCVAEFKTHGDKSYKKLEQDGVKKSKPQHYSQMQLYMHWSGMRKAFYLAVNKNTDELYGEFVDYDADHAEQLVSKASRIIATDTAPARMTDDPTYYECKRCDAYFTCHSDATGAVNCRTCIHGKPVEGGKWQCNFHNKPISTAEQRKACPDHVFLPDMIPYAKPVDANPTENWVEYETTTGEKFKNGKCDWPSDELPFLDCRLVADDSLKQIRKAFDGKVINGAA